MKVILFNGSPNIHGCTYTALREVADALEAEQIETEIIQIGGRVRSGCLACDACRKTGKCAVDDVLNGVLEKISEADGIIVGSPVHYASAGGDITSFMDRLFRIGSDIMAYKPGAAVVSARRAGTTAALDQLNKYFTINKMPLVSSQYWNMVHGNTPEQVRQDLEGMQVMRALGHNMAWLLKCIELGRQNGIVPVFDEEHAATNFIR